MPRTLRRIPVPLLLLPALSLWLVSGSSSAATDAAAAGGGARSPYEAGSSALVLGVGSYTRLRALDFAAIDAVRVARGLLDHGFRVRLVTDVDYPEIPTAREPARHRVARATR